jgi:AraC-like DNA-binding protein
MRAAESIAHFLEEPVGQYVIRRHLMVWCQSPRLCGSAFWGRPDATDVDELAQLYDLDLRPGLTTPFDVITDGRYLTEIDVFAMQRLVRYWVRRIPELGKRIRKQAVIRPGGLSGIIMAGVYQVFQPRHALQIFDNAGAAYQWIDPESGAQAAAEVESILDEVRGASPTLEALRRYIGDNLADLEIAGAARALGLSERSLQRALNEVGTSFRAEVIAARVRTAETLLAQTDMPIAEVGRIVGCISAAHFSALFRRITKQSPAQYRAAARAKGNLQRA